MADSAAAKPAKAKKVTLKLPEEGVKGPKAAREGGLRQRHAARAQAATGAGAGAGAGASEPVQLPMKFVDMALLRLGQADARMDNVIHGLMYLDRGVTRDELVDIIKARWLPAHVRVRSHIAPKGKTFVFQEQTEFDWDYHVKTATLEGPVDRAALYKYIGDMFEEKMDTSKPLWQFIAVDGITGIEGVTAAVVSRCHHCMGDGSSLVHLFLNRLIDSPKVTATPRTRSSGKARKRAVDTGLLAPVRRVSRAVRVACLGAVAGLVKPALPRDTTTVWKAAHPLKCGGPRNLTTSEPLPLSIFKDIKNAVGGTVNDVLVSVLCGAARRYLIAHGDAAAANNASTSFRTAFPLNTRPRGADMDETLGNDFVLLSMSFPLHIADPVERLVEVKRRCDDMKRSPETPLVAVLNKFLLNTVPAKTYTDITVKLFDKFTFMFTNVIGPPEEVTVAGRRVVDMAFWVPTPIGNLASILTYNNHVTLGVAAVPHLMPDTGGRLVDFFAEELNELHGMLKQGRVKPRVGCGRQEVSDFVFCTLVLPLIGALLMFIVFSYLL